MVQPVWTYLAVSRYPLRFAAAAVLALASSAHAVDTTLVQAGFTGVGITPNARVLRWGTLGLAYDNQLPGFPNPKGHNLVAGIGLFPGLEISGRIASNDLNSNCFAPPGCQARDLSANAKIALPLDANGKWHIAGGATDAGGEINFVNTVYGVLTYSTDFFDASAGAAKRRNTTRARPGSPLNGVFGNVVAQPLPWLQGHLEYSDNNAWAGAKLLAPTGWLPQGWNAFAGVNFRLNDNRHTEKSWATVGLTIPLYAVPRLPDAGPKAEPIALLPNQAAEPSYPATVLPPVLQQLAPPAPPASQAPPSEEDFRVLAIALEEKGLEDISVGRLPDGGIAVRANNATYNWNALDAMGVALGLISRQFGSSSLSYRIVLTQRQLPFVGVTGQTNCLKDWIDGRATTCTAGQLFSAGSGDLDELHSGVTWTIREQAGSWKTVRVGLSPVLRTAVATEVGVFDYSLGLRAAFQLPLWQGAVGEIRQVVPVANSSNFSDTGIYSGRRIRSRIDRALFSQAVRVPIGMWTGASPAQATKWGLSSVVAQVHAGRINDYYDGAMGELRWEPGEGRYRIAAQAGWFTMADYHQPVKRAGVLYEPKVATPILASYRYSLMRTRTDFEATGGRFMNRDTGVQLGMTQWFSDVAVSVYYRHTTLDPIPARQFVGVTLSLPLGPRKDMSPGKLVQVTGTPRFGHSLETVVGRSNLVSPGYGVLPDVPDLDSIHNSDRASLLYFEDNMRRIRDAAR